ncbi:MAG TPA: hypothetical protein PLO89_09510, partial [Spirochaetota bacterium]|nr:hypothetical protein [Spirochaetota bacterium]
MYDFLGKFTNVIEREGKEISSDDLRYSGDLLKNNLSKFIPNCEDVRIYIDIKDRYLFINLFFSLLSLKAKIVLLPIEIKNEDYYFND